MEVPIDRIVRFEHYYQGAGKWWVTRIETTTSLVAAFETYDEARALWDRLHAEEPTE